MQDHEAAVAAYDAVIEAVGQADFDAVRESVASALLDKAYALEGCGKSIESLVLYDSLIDRFIDDRYEPVGEQVAQAFFNKVGFLGGVGSLEEKFGSTIRSFTGSNGTVRVDSKACGYGVGQQKRDVACRGTFRGGAAVCELLLTYFDGDMMPEVQKVLVEAIFNRSQRLG